jgi:DNA-binding transcriptional ArsR family regulator
VKRDMELVRKLLLFLEEKPDHVVRERVELEGYDDVTIGHHLIILYEAGYIEGEPQVSTSSKRIIRVWPNRLTWEGHEFLAASRNETVWKKVKAKLTAGAGDIPIAILKELLLTTLRGQLEALS